MKRFLLPILGAGLFLAGCAPGDSAADKAPEPAAPTTGSGPDAGAAATAGGYAAVQSLLSAKCMPCHGENGKDGVDLRSFDSVMKGGNDGPIVVAGDAAGSLIIQVLRGLNGKKQMPFNQAPLSEAEIKIVEDWIAAGAKAE